MNTADTGLAKLLTWKDLHTANFEFNAPFRLALDNDEVFSAEQVVRVLPKRRLVAFGYWQGKPAVAKLFFDAKRAAKHIKRDVAGVNSLLENKIPTPAIYYQGLSQDRRIYVLIFERIMDADNLEVLWKQRQDVQQVVPVLQAVILELATQHVLGVLQKDLHLKNFLVTEKTIYTLDGGEIDFLKILLSKKMSINSLSLFLSQFGIGMEALQEKLFRFYAKSRGWLVKPGDVAEVFFTIKKCNADRWQQFEKKIFRECTAFVRIHDWKKQGMCDREYAGEEMLYFLQHPDEVIAKSQMLKAGRSATVIKANLDGREFVIKRYNLKNWLHRLRRCLRPTRAHSAWRLAQKINLFAVATAKPVAYLENKCLGFYGKSYYVTEYVEGEHLGEYFKDKNIIERNTMIKAVADLLKNLSKLEMTHGDLKMTNILVNAKTQPVLIDLDGASEHVSLSGLRKSWTKEIKRFLKNFQYQPDLQQAFKKELK